eukprot:4453452-Pleurochrysis_carterae.AAC.2
MVNDALQTRARRCKSSNEAPASPLPPLVEARLERDELDLGDLPLTLDEIEEHEIEAEPAQHMHPLGHAAVETAGDLGDDEGPARLEQPVRLS